MIELELERKLNFKGAVHGILTKEGRYVCHTLEHDTHMLAPGRYPLTLKRHYVSEGNGVYTLRTSRIIVGEYRCRGLLIHTRQAYHRIYQRLKKALERKEEVVLVIH